ncbi:HAMP domain-containing sensor histidine kinase [Granulosicoccaceae sp. 1_MG-2023]|nr:HAMP domain-containing sensor histidine kinase [Granulosicoccaceae sp. 1_MG-2023]
MKFPSLSLRASLLLSLSAVSVVLVSFYALLSSNFFLRGMDNIISTDMESAARHYTSAPLPGQTQHPRFDWISHDWQDMPPEILDAMPEPPQRDESLIVKRVKPGGGTGQQQGRVVFAMRLPTAEGPLYIARTQTRAERSPLFGRNVRANQLFLATVVLCTLAGLTLLFWWLARRFMRPVTRLGRWTEQLSPHSLREPLPDFEYPELNNMAALIRRSLSDVQAALDREQRFLGHASHELRTPISVIRSNVGLMQKLQSRRDTDDPALRQVCERLDRASLTMKHLTETLLWLSRENEMAPRHEELLPGTLIRQILDELQYLREGKTVDVALTVVREDLLCLPAVPTHIILSNLIRNALQHTESGTVRIILDGTTVQIANPLPAGSSGKASESGFGLGLQLTRQLSERLGWSLQRLPDTRHYAVRVNLQKAG